jgi:hypothetical protein
MSAAAPSFKAAERAYRRHADHANACEACQTGYLCAIGKILTRIWQDAEDRHRGAA